MKLTAPPPPPPEPSDSRGSGQKHPQEPLIAAANDPAASAGEARPVSWPAWFQGADVLMVVLVLSLTFLVSSFVARNSDVWLHLAAGKRFLAGEYRLGTDPFSFSAADRTWVNHSLLFDIGAALLYGGNGIVLGVVKALVLVLAFGLVLALRRPGHSFWPWAAVGGVAVIAAAPQMHIRPVVASMLLLAVTLFLSFRMPHRSASWRFPIAIGVTFWLWAMLDSWFILGPFAIGLMLLGEVIQSRFRGTASTDEPETLGRLPAVPVLGKALLIGILACTLTPHHIRIWQLPFEILGTQNEALDLRLRAVLMTPLDKIYRDNAALGMNINGLAYVLLFVGGGVVLGLGFGRVRIAHIALWIGFAALSLSSIVAIAFFAIVAVPLVASRLNAFSISLVPKTWADPKTRFLLLGSAAGRVACLLILAMACAFSWPGWMQPESANPAFSRRVSWGIEPDPGLVRVALRLQELHDADKIPAGSHGLITSIDLANYCAWFAPSEKVYLNNNYILHKPELAQFIASRKEVFSYPELPHSHELGLIMENTGADYLVVATIQNESPILRTIQPAFSLWLWTDPEHWSGWYLDGRATITGYRSSPDRASAFPAFKALRLDPVVLAFGPAVEKVPPIAIKPLPPVEGWEGEFVHGTSMCPTGADESIAWTGYRQFLGTEHTIQEELCERFSRMCPSPTGLLPQELAAYTGYRRRGMPATAAATPLLALRAAHRAIAADPDHPDGYYALFQALQDSELPLSQPERSLAQVTALRQCLFRLPPPERYQPQIYRAKPAEIAIELADYYSGLGKPGIPIDTNPMQIVAYHRNNPGVIYVMPNSRGGYERLPRWRLNPQQIPNRAAGPFLQATDLAREMVLLAAQYVAKENSTEAESLVKRVEAYKKAVEADLVKKNGDYERERLQGQVKLVPQLESALKHNLVGEALKILTDKWPELAKESPKFLPEYILLRIGLELAIGKIEDATADLASATQLLETAAVPDEAKAGMAAGIHLLTYQSEMLEGNYQAAGESTERGIVNRLGVDPPMNEKDKAFKPAPFIALGGYGQVLQIFQLAPIPPVGFFMRDELFNQLAQPLAYRQKLQDVRVEASSYYNQRGVLALLQGDIPTAKLRFEQSRIHGVSAWGVPEVRNSSAERYLRLIAEAERKAVQK